MKRFRPARVFLSTLLGFGLISQLQAHTVNLGTINNEHAHSFYDQSTPGAFTDAVTIRENELSDISGAVIQSGVTVTRATVNPIMGSVSDRRWSPWAGGGAYSFADLARGTTHTLAISRMRPSFYRNVLTVAAVPEAETWLMILTGLGLVSFQLRRTQKLLQHVPLAA